MVRKPVGRIRYVVYGALLLCTVYRLPSAVHAQQPQAQSGQPIYAVNAKYVQGVGPGYWPTKGSALVLNLAGGTAYCGNPPIVTTYAGGTLTMTDGAVNYVYLDPANSCAPAKNTVGFSPGHIPLAKVTTSGGTISDITDARNWFAPQPCAMSSTGAINCAALGTDQHITLAPVGNGVLSTTAKSFKLPNHALVEAATDEVDLYSNYDPTTQKLADPTKPNWDLCMGCTMDEVSIWRAPPTAGYPTWERRFKIDANGNLSFIKSLNRIRYASEYAQADASGKIAACIADLPATGGICDARGLEGAQTFSSNPFVNANKPITLITGAATYSWNPEAFLLDIPSNFRLIAENTTFTTSAPGKGGYDSTYIGLFNTRLTQTTGSISTGTPTLTVASATNFVPGALVAVLGGEGGNSNQTTTIDQVGGLGPSDTSVTVVSTSGFGAGYLMIDSEILSYSGTTSTSFTGLGRGLFGTAAASHANGATVKALGYFVSQVVSVSGTTVTLADNVSFSVSNAPVLVGSVNISFEGNLTLDGNQNRAGADPTYNLVGIAGLLSRYLRVAPTITLKNLDHGGVYLQATRDSYISGVYSGNGRPADSLGADVWLFGKNRRNKVDTISHEDGYIAFALDDRSTTFGLLDGTNDGNTFRIGPANKVKSGVVIQGGANYNFGQAESIDAASDGISINSIQWTTNPVPTGNVVYAGRVRGETGNSMLLAGSAANGGNLVVAGDVSGGSPSISPGNSVLLRDSSNGFQLFGGGVFSGLFEQRSGAAAQIFEWYRTYTDASNYERVTLDTNFASGPGFVFERAGTGTARPFHIGNESNAATIFRTNGTDRWRFDANGNLTAEVDATYDLGAEGSARPRSIYVARRVVAGLNTVTFSTTPTFDASLGNTQKITLTGNVTSSTLANATTGQQINFLICQDSTGNRTFVWPTNVLGGMTIGSTASKCSAQTFIFDGTNAFALSSGVTNM